jgi:hypothetical protein
VQARLAERRSIADQVEQQRLVPGPDLTQEEGIHDLRGGDQLDERGPLARRERLDVDHQIDGRETADNLFSAAASGVGVGAASGSASGADAARADNTKTKQKMPARAILIMVATVAQQRDISIRPGRR